MGGVVVCFLISLSLFLTLGAAFERRERLARDRSASLPVRSSSTARSPVAVRGSRVRPC